MSNKKVNYPLGIITLSQKIEYRRKLKKSGVNIIWPTADIILKGLRK